MGSVSSSPIGRGMRNCQSACPPWPYLSVYRFRHLSTRGQATLTATATVVLDDIMLLSLLWLRVVWSCRHCAHFVTTPIKPQQKIHWPSRTCTSCRRALAIFVQLARWKAQRAMPRGTCWAAAAEVKRRGLEICTIRIRRQNCLTRCPCGPPKKSLLKKQQY